MVLSLAIATAFLVTLTLMPVIIRVTKSINLLDRPDKRKIHSVSTPSLGGVAIFSGIMLSLLISVAFADLASEKFFLGAVSLIFILGVRDDLSSLLAKHKLIVQIFAAFLVVYLGGIKIDGLNGLFGIESFGWYFDEIFTVSVIVILTNAFNLIDGIDGLAGTIALVISLFFGWTFYHAGMFTDAAISLSIAGASLGFLLYNWYPSKIFMGDTGSMVLGFMLTSLMVKFLSISSGNEILISPVALCLALFILPVYDTLRVFLIRFFTGRPPLAPDRNHIHHVLLKLGYNHAQSTIYLIGYSVFIIGFTYAFQSIGELWLILCMSVMTTTIGALLDRKLIRRESARLAKIIPPEIKLTETHTSV